MTRTRTWTTRIGRITLGVLFLASGALKLIDPELFATGVKAFRLGLPLAVIERGAYVIPWIEVAIGACLLLAVWARAAALLAIALLLVFSGAMLSLIVRGLDVECSCFGSLQLVCRGPVGVCHLMRNAALAGIAMWVVVARAKPSAALGRAPGDGVRTSGAPSSEGGFSA